MRSRLCSIITLGLLTLPSTLQAQGHGPAYALSTPTLGRGGWSLDLAVMGRRGDGDGASMLRGMLSYGVTEDVQLSVSLPLPLSTSGEMEPVRAMTRMPMTRDVEALLGWRFQRRGLAVGSRLESTLYVGADVPLDDVRGGVDTAPGLYAGLVGGYASRSWYAWLGGLYRRYAAGSGGADRVGDVAMYSAVVGYRPPAFRRELPHSDWRLFVEVVGEVRRPDRLNGVESPASGGQEIFAGPTVLGLFGAWGVSGGPVFPLHQDLRGGGGDRVRLVVNTTFWF